MAGCVDVLCDGAGRLGPLSYWLPEDTDAPVGMEVTVPLGTRVVTGVVVGYGDEGLADRTVLTVGARRAQPSDITVAYQVAREHFCEPHRTLARLAPTRAARRSQEPLQPGPLTHTDDALAGSLPSGDPPARKRALLRAPGVDPAALAAAAAADIHRRRGGQTLVLCPTVALTDRVCAAYRSGAVRLSASTRDASWRAAVDGDAPVAVGTRASALYALPQLTGIVVVEDDHPGHVEAAMPYTHARQVADVRAGAAGAELVGISMLPDAAALGGGTKAFEVGGRAHWPQVEVLDRGNLPPSDRWLPSHTTAAIDRAVAAGHPVCVVAPAGRSVLRCVACGDPVGGDTDTQPHAPCRGCGDRARRRAGWDRIRTAELYRADPDCRPGTAGQVAVVGPYGIPAGLGGLVVVHDPQATPAGGNLDPHRSAAHTLLSAAQAAGSDGRLLIVTDDPDDLTVQALRSRRLRPLAVRTWRTAAQVGLPPFKRLVRLRTASGPPRTDGIPGRLIGPRRIPGDPPEWELLIQVDADRLPSLAPAVRRFRRAGRARVTVI